MEEDPRLAVVVEEIVAMVAVLGAAHILYLPSMLHGSGADQEVEHIPTSMCHGLVVVLKGLDTFQKGRCCASLGFRAAGSTGYLHERYADRFPTRV